jgi:hypothetical protein
MRSNELSTTKEPLSDCEEAAFCEPSAPPHAAVANKANVARPAVRHLIRPDRLLLGFLFIGGVFLSVISCDAQTMPFLCFLRMSLCYGDVIESLKICATRWKLEEDNLEFVRYFEKTRMSPYF